MPARCATSHRPATAALPEVNNSSLSLHSTPLQAGRFRHKFEARHLNSGVVGLRPSQDHNEVSPALSAKAMAEVLLSSDLLETLPDAIVAVDRDGSIVQVNSQAQELFGYDRDELIGQKVEMLVPESYRRQHHHHRQTFVETPKTRRMGADLDLYGRRRNGSEFPVEISLSPVATENGTTFVLSAIRDISDRKRISEEL